MAKKKNPTSKKNTDHEPVVEKKPPQQTGDPISPKKHPSASGLVSLLEFPVVGMGASAGGLEALKIFFRAMPVDKGIAFVLIQHLAPTHPSLTAELLGHQTTMPVMEVIDKTAIRPNQVYVIPPNKSLALVDGTLELSEPEEKRGLRLPIDFFFRSLAGVLKEKAIGVILSGSGSDGTLGAREIKAAGGMVMVQDPGTTQQSGMPNSAIEAGVADYVLIVEKMPEALLSYVDHWYINGGNESTKEPPLDFLGKILALIRTQIKYDFSGYKKMTLTRRVHRRMGLLHLSEMSRYLQFLRDHPLEVKALFKDLLIGVTNFFREPDSWEELTNTVIKPLVAEKDTDDIIRIWVAGCSTGEEAYSMAMVIVEQLQQAGKFCVLQIFASDIDQDALRFARNGKYPENIEVDVSSERLKQFFVKGDHSYRINKEIRETVVFAEQNLISDPPFSKMDLISCRNLLIYLEVELQKKILTLFHFALRQGGCLFLGNAETIAQNNELFQPVSRKWRIYRRIGGPAHQKIDLPAPKSEPVRKRLELATQANRPEVTLLPKMIQQLLLNRFSPGCVVINRKLEVLYLSGPINNYLQLPTGELGSDLIALAREELRSSLRAAVHQAIQENILVSTRGAGIKRDHSVGQIRITVEPLKSPLSAEGLLLITFSEETIPSPGKTEKAETEAGKLIRAGTPGELEAVIHQLEVELNSTREDLQTTIEELETSSEEFKAANEEITSLNEELQSTNEELETSKEELQSLNEELSTVNIQLESKVNELEETNNDLKNLLDSTDLATIFLDRNFRIKRFTPAISRLLPVIPTDLGRLFSDIAKNFTDVNLISDCEAVLENLTLIEKELKADDGRWYLRRVTPYRTQDLHIGGVVITFADITEIKQAQEELKRTNEDLERRVAERTEELQRLNQKLEADYQELTRAAETRRRLAAILETSAVAIIIAKIDGIILNWNSGAEQLYGISSEEALGQNIARLLPPERLKEIAEIVDKLGQGELVQEFETVHVRKNGHRVEVSLTASAIRDEQGHLTGFCVLANDISERRKAEHQLAELADHEQQRIGQELHDTLSQQITALGLLISSLHEKLKSDSSPHLDLVSRIEQGIEQAKAQTRSVLKGLLPLGTDSASLPLALENLAEQMCKSYDVRCRFTCEAQHLEIPSLSANHLYRIAQEATYNAVKHSNSKRIDIQLQNGNNLTLTIRDYGGGFSDSTSEEGGMGLKIMRHRASLIGATLQVESTPGKGTIIRCTIPRLKGG